MEKERPDYQSFLLRLWQVEKDGTQVWRAYLESIESGEQRGFQDLEALIEHLEAFTEGLSNPVASNAGAHSPPPIDPARSNPEN